MTTTHSIQWNVVVVGGANYDYLIRGPRLPGPGDTVAGQTFQEAPGGKGANQAVAAARLGARVAFIGRVGDDQRGDAIVERLAREGVDTRYVSRHAKTPTGIALVMVAENGQKQILSLPGANHSFTVADIYAAKEAICGARVMLTQLEIPLECVLAAARAANEAGTRVILDPAPPKSVPEELLRLTDVIKPNAGEAQVLTGRQVEDCPSARDAAQELLKRGVGAVAIQAGNEGDLLIWCQKQRQHETWLPRLEVDSVDATGAGDAFAAALAVAIAEGCSLEEAGPFASAAAALKTTKLGAQAGLPHRGGVMALLAKNW